MLDLIVKNQLDFLNDRMISYLNNNRKIKILRLLSKEFKASVLHYYKFIGYPHLKLLPLLHTIFQYQYKVIVSDTNTTNEHLKYLSNCHKLDLRSTDITDEGLKYLSNCHRLNLYLTAITDEGLKYLSNCSSLNLPRRITDEGLKHLSHCHTLNLGLTQITNEGLKYLSNCHVVKLWRTNITDEGIDYLKSVKVLYYVRITENKINELKSLGIKINGFKN